MAVKIRLARHGATKKPFYRVVVTDGRSPRDGRFIEVLGRYNPRTEPSFVELDVEKTEAWIAKGAQPSEAVSKILAIAKGEKEPPTEAAPRQSKKSRAKEAAEAEAAAKAAAEPPADEAPAEEAAEEATAEAEDAPADEPEAEAEEAPADEPEAEGDADESAE